MMESKSEMASLARSNDNYDRAGKKTAFLTFRASRLCAKQIPMGALRWSLSSAEEVLPDAVVQEDFLEEVSALFGLWRLVRIDRQAKIERGAFAVLTPGLDVA